MSDETSPSTPLLQIFATLAAGNIESVMMSWSEGLSLELSPNDLTQLRFTDVPELDNQISIWIRTGVKDDPLCPVEDCVLKLQDGKGAIYTDVGQLWISGVPLTKDVRTFTLELKVPSQEVMQLEFDLGIHGAPANDGIEVPFDDIKAPDLPPPTNCGDQPTMLARGSRSRSAGHHGLARRRLPACGARNSRTDLSGQPCAPQGLLSAELDTKIQT